jgi:FkbM family methyltransferase
LKRIFEIIGLDYPSRSLYRRFQEWKSGVRNIEVDDTSGRFADFTLIGDQYLDAEFAVLSDLLKEIRSDDVFYDIGADAGLYTVLVATKVPRECLISFEPHPLRRESLQRNMKRNGVEATIRTEALGNKSGSVSLSYALHTDETKEMAETGSEGFSVKVKRADNLIPGELPPPNVVKIDVEGAELSVLKGFGNILDDSSCRVIYIEVHDKITNFGGSKKELISLLNQNGYEIREMLKRQTGQTEELFIKAVNISD